MMIDAINEYVKEVCKRLSIYPPKITVGGEFATKTTLAACSEDGSEIILRDDGASLDSLFAIAHELRHVWQIRTAKDKYMEGYKSAKELDVLAYNLQSAEVDANAFAALIIIEAFGAYPKFDGLPAEAVAKIRERMNEINWI